MLLDLIKNMLKGSPEVIKKSDVEKILDLTFKGLKEDVLPVFQELAKLKPEAFNKNMLLLLSKSLKGKDGVGVANSYITTINNLIKEENNVRATLKYLPENIPTHFITSKKASTISLISNLASFVFISMDMAILLVSKATDTDFSKENYKNMNSNIETINTLIYFVNDTRGFLNSLTKADDEININEENNSIEAILKSKSGIPLLPNLGFAFIGKISYNIRTWLVEREIAKYELLKQKKNYLLKKILEIENELSNNPEDVRLKKAKDVYIIEIEKLTYKINKLAEI